MRVLRLPVLLLAMSLSGCGLFSDDEEEEEVPTDLTEQDLFPTQGVPIQAVREIEIGRTRDGFVITAFGTAQALGFGNPRLRARRDGLVGADGFLDFDFVATPPRPGLERGQGTIAARELRADALLQTDALRGVSGIRVHALAGGVQLVF
ncbi:MAG: hypothetical protein AAGE80_15410 [Pseudomonadota bacterium]